MKVIFLLLTVALGSVATVANVQHLASMKNQIAAALPALPKATPDVENRNDQNGTADDASAPILTSLNSTDDVVRQYGQPQRKERSWDGSYVWYYPTYVVYVGSRIVIHRCTPHEQSATAQTNISPTRPVTMTSTTLNRWQPGPSTAGAGWKATTNSLGTVSLNRSGPTRTFTAGGSGQSSAGPTSHAIGSTVQHTMTSAAPAPRAVVSTVHAVHTSTATYRPTAVSVSASVPVAH